MTGYCDLRFYPIDLTFVPSDRTNSNLQVINFAFSASYIFRPYSKKILPFNRYKILHKKHRIEFIYIHLYSNTRDKTEFWNKLKLFPLINKANFLKYQGYPTMHIYMVLALVLFRVATGNQWKTTLRNNVVQMNVLIYLKIYS